VPEIIRKKMPSQPQLESERYFRGGFSCPCSDLSCDAVERMYALVSASDSIQTRHKREGALTCGAGLIVSLASLEIRIAELMRST
jgi:hypothetical protein